MRGVGRSEEANRKKVLMKWNIKNCFNDVAHSIHRRLYQPDLLSNTEDFTPQKLLRTDMCISRHHPRHNPFN